MGEGFGAIFDFKPDVMAARYQIPLQQLLSAIGILDRSGYFEYVDEIDIEAQVMILLRRDELYSLELSTLEEEIMNFMLRRYTGLFADLVPVNESAVAAGLRHSHSVAPGTHNQFHSATVYAAHCFHSQPRFRIRT